LTTKKERSTALIATRNNIDCEIEMIAKPSKVMSAAQCREKEAECRNMSTLKSLTQARRLELQKMADDWARLAKAQET